MSLPDLVPVFDMNVFDSTACDMAFVLEKLQQDGTSYDPKQYRDITGKIIVLIMTGIFRDDFELSSAVGANLLGSILSITDAPNGAFQWHLDQSDMARITKQTGYFRVVERAAGIDDVIFFRGTVSVVPFNESGVL